MKNKKESTKKKKLNIKILIIGGVALALIGIIIFIVLINKKPEVKKPVEKPMKVVKKVQIIDESSKTRPYAIMINNIHEARRVQSSLNKAYIVYEIIVEGGLTRYMALYKDVSEAVIGSVRSARHYYLDYALENDAIYVHWGWSPQAQGDIRNLRVNNINGLSYDGIYFYRVNTIGAPHNGFTNMDLLNTARERLKYASETEKENLFKYSAESINLGEFESIKDADIVNISYSQSTNVKYEYDKESLRYNRYADGVKQIDYESNTPVTVKNIIVYQINNYTLNDGMGKGRQELKNIGSGKGVYITEGKAIDINWSKSSRSEQTIYTDEKGNRLTLNDGNTFIQIVPTSGSVVISNNG